MSTAHRRFTRITAHFTTIADAVPDWSVSTPVPGWQARDVVDHLVTWLPGLLSGAGVILPEVGDPGPDVQRPAPSPADAWRTFRGSVAELLASPVAAASFEHPHAAAPSVAEAIDRFWTTDVLLHTWDLARATGQPHGLDEVEAMGLWVEMRGIELQLRGSGHYGPAVPVPPGSSAVDQLMGFIGRDPTWAPMS